MLKAITTRSEVPAVDEAQTVSATLDDLARAGAQRRRCRRRPPPDLTQSTTLDNCSSMSDKRAYRTRYMAIRYLHYNQHITINTLSISPSSLSVRRVRTNMGRVFLAREARTLMRTGRTIPQSTLTDAERDLLDVGPAHDDGAGTRPAVLRPCYAALALQSEVGHVAEEPHRTGRVTASAPAGGRHAPSFRGPAPGSGPTYRGSCWSSTRAPSTKRG
jgi:hypothetical protein